MMIPVDDVVRYNWKKYFRSRDENIGEKSEGREYLLLVAPAAGNCHWHIGEEHG